MTQVLKPLIATAAVALTTGMAQADDVRQIGLDAFDALFVEFDTEKAASLLHPDYIQHNPAVPTGAAAILGFVPALQQMGFEATNHRTFVDGDMVVMHNSFGNAQAIAGVDTIVTFDIFRVEDGLIVEHWDNIQPLTGPNPSGRSMIDGATEIADLDKIQENKDLVRGLITDVFIGGDFGKVANYISAESYTQHNPQIGDGLDGLVQAVTALAAQGITFEYDTLHYVLGEGNFVLAMAEGKLAGEHTAFYDLFRVEDGKIVEHWDVIEAIPAEAANTNGKF